MITSIYIHIPFCEHLCTYCDFCKQFYNENIVNKYLEALAREIKENYHDEVIKTMYIGGGTPSCLNEKELEKLFKTLSTIKVDKNIEFTFECNPENITMNKLIILKKYGVNRISLGVESTNEQFLKYLGRNHDFNTVKEKIELIKKVGIENINVDLIYALPKQTISAIKKDLDNLLTLDITHISTYSLEIHPNTLLGIKKTKNISEDLDSDMYYFICKYLKDKGFIHYEVSNFCKNDYYSKHNLVYWHNEKYYGFGLGASGYINNLRYTNTRSLHEYLEGHIISYQEKLTVKDLITYELILGFRLINGINKQEFKEKYHKELIEQYNISNLIEMGYLVDDGLNIKVSYDKIYVENSILENFVESE